MTSKQTSRIYYRGKDHKDVFFNGKYHSIMAAKNDLGCDGVIWRKLYPDKYYMLRCSQWWLNGYQGVVSHGIYYPGIDSYRESYRFLEGTGTIKGSNFIIQSDYSYQYFGYSGTHNVKSIYISKDGKCFKTLELDHYICAYPVIVPDGFIYKYNDGEKYSGGTNHYYHVRINDDLEKDGDEEEVYSTTNYFSQIYCPHIGSDSDKLLYTYSGSDSVSRLYAMDLNGNISASDLPTSNTDYATGRISYQNGRYIMPVYTYTVSNKVYYYTQYICESTDGISWTKHRISGLFKNMLAVIWDGSQYIVYGDEYYDGSDSNTYRLTIYTGKSLGSLARAKDMGLYEYGIKYINMNRDNESDVTLVFDSKYLEWLYNTYPGIYRVTSDVIHATLNTGHFKNYKQVMPQEIAVGSTTLNKYGAYTYYRTLYIDNLMLDESDNNFIAYNYVSGNEYYKKWGADIAEYYARG